MPIRGRRRRFLPALTLSIAAFALASTGCMQYAADGSVVTPAPPGDASSSRLPSLLSQLQGTSGAGIELLDGSQNQVLAAQETGGKAAPADATSTVAGESTRVATSTPVSGTPTRATNPARTPTPTRTPTQAPDEDNTAAPTATPSPTKTPTAAPTATPSPSPTPILTPTPAAPPSEGTGGGGTPPTE